MNPEYIPMIDRKVNLVNYSNSNLYELSNSKGSGVLDFGIDIEKKRLELIIDLIEKRKKVRDIALNRIDEIILYCHNKILNIRQFSIGQNIKVNDWIIQWQKKITDLEMAKLGEHKELFRDTLFLRNEWIKALLDYYESVGMNEAIGGFTTSDNSYYN